MQYFAVIVKHPAGLEEIKCGLSQYRKTRVSHDTDTRFLGLPVIICNWSVVPPSPPIYTTDP